MSSRLQLLCMIDAGEESLISYKMRAPRTSQALASQVVEARWVEVSFLQGASEGTICATLP